MRRTWITILAFVLISACNLSEKLQEVVYVYVSGEVAAALSAEATVSVQEQLLESLTGMDAEYQGDGKWVMIPVAGQPGLGDDTTAPTSVNVSLAPSYFKSATTVTKTGYVAASTPGPDGLRGWYQREYNGYIFYYKTAPAADLSQAWPANVQTLWSGWRGASSTHLKGYSWWIKSDVASSTRVRGEWHFDIGADAPKYAGTRYAGSYDYERVPDRKVNSIVTGEMKLVNGSEIRESYTHYAYSFTNATNVEAGKFYFGVGPANVFHELPAWAAGQNPAGDEWTNNPQRPGLYQYKVWVDQSASWWKYDGTSEVCSTTPAYIQLSGGGTVTAGKTLQLSGTAYNACSDVLRYRSLEWASSDDAIAAVSAQGLVSGFAAGQVEITAKSGAASSTINVTVREPDRKPNKVIIAGGASVQAGSTVKLTGNVYNKHNELLEGAAVTWQSLNTGVASVDSEGVVSGVADGTTTIRATAGEVFGDVSFRVYDPSVVSTVSLSCPSSRTVVGAAAVQCTATGYNYAGQSLGSSGFTWTSGNTGVLTVDSNGNVTAVAKGNTTVTASVNGKQQQITFVVYNQNDVSYVVIASANGSSLRLGDSEYKLALTAKAYNVLGDEIPGVSFTWSTMNASVAQVTAGSPSNTAEVSAGSLENSTTIKATTSSSVVGNFSVGNWDERVQTIRLVNGGFGDTSSVSMAFASTYQLYVEAKNAQGRLLGYVTPTWTVPAGLSMNANGLLTAGNTFATGLSVQAAVPKGDGSGNATDTLSVNVYDAVKPVSLTNSCTSTYEKFAGTTLNCTVTSRNWNNGTISGSPVTWYVSNPSLLTITSQLDTGSPGTVQFQVPADLANGGSVTFKAYTACTGTPNSPSFSNCLVSGQGTVNARGTADIKNVAITSPVNGTKIGAGSSTVLVATAYDYQNQPMSGVTFTFQRQSGTSFTVPSGPGAVTASTTGDTYFQATAFPGGVVQSPSSGFYLRSVDPAVATVVTLHTNPAVVSSLRPYQTFTAWAEASNGLGQAIAAPTFNFTTSNPRLEVMASTATTATVRFVKCDCSNSATNSATLYATIPGEAQASRSVTVKNPVYNVTVNDPGNMLLPEGLPHTVDVTVTGYLDGQAAPLLTTVTLLEIGTSPAYDVAGLSLVSLSFIDTYSIYVDVYAEDASTASSRTVTWSFKIDPTPIDMTGVATGSPALANGYLAKEYYYFPNALAFNNAITYATWATTGVAPERTFTNITRQALTVGDGTHYGVAKLSTGQPVTSRIGVRTVGYFNLSSNTLYLRSQSWERVRVTIGGNQVIDEWNTTGALAVRTVKLTNLPAFTWVPIEVEGLMDAGQPTFGQAIGYVQWSTDGTYFYDSPQSVGAQLAQDF